MSSQTQPKDEQSDEVELLFSPPPQRRRDIQEAGFGDLFKPNPVKLSKLKEWFKDYEINKIELWLEGTASTGGLIQLLVSLEGTGGCKVTLKPKNDSWIHFFFFLLWKLRKCIIFTPLIRQLTFCQSVNMKRIRIPSGPLIMYVGNLFFYKNGRSLLERLLISYPIFILRNPIHLCNQSEK